MATPAPTPSPRRPWPNAPPTSSARAPRLPCSTGRSRASTSCVCSSPTGCATTGCRRRPATTSISCPAASRACPSWPGRSPRPATSFSTSTPTYMTGLEIFRTQGLRTQGVPTDDEGLRTDVLEDVLAQHRRAGRCRPCCTRCRTSTTPRARSCPTGRRQHLAEVAARYELPVLEDNPYRWMRFEGEPVAPLAAHDDGQQVISVGSFSKILAPGLRVAWMTAPAQSGDAWAASGSSWPRAPLQLLIARYFSVVPLAEHCPTRQRCTAASATRCSTPWTAEMPRPRRGPGRPAATTCGWRRRARQRPDLAPAPRRAWSVSGVGVLPRRSAGDRPLPRPRQLCSRRAHREWIAILAQVVRDLRTRLDQGDSMTHIRVVATGSGYQPAPASACGPCRVRRAAAESERIVRLSPGRPPLRPQAPQ